MSIVQSKLFQFTNCSNNVDLQAEFLYPKMVLFENTQSFRIVDIEAKNEDQSFVFNVDYDIIDKALLDHMLWLVLKSGEIIVAELLKGSKIKILSDNYKVCRLKTNRNKLYLISESGECLVVPYSTEDLLAKIEAGITELHVSLQRTSNHAYLEMHMTINGLNTFIEGGILKTKCPVTGLLDTISTNVTLENVLHWEDKVVIANKSNMWLVDLKDSQIIFAFENAASNYYPVMVHNNILYYLLWNADEVQIHSASTASTSSGQINNYEGSLIDSSHIMSSQETLKNQLKLLVNSIIQAVKPIAQDSMQLQGLFEKIDDNAFLIDLSSKLCQHDMNYKSVLFSLQKKVHATGNSSLINMISDLIIKIDLLEYINFRGNNHYEDVNLFEKKFKELCITFISKSDLDLASICWLKYADMELTMSSDDILEILNAIPHNTKMGAIIIWLRNYVPRLLEQNPFTIDLFVRWTTERVFKLEQSGYWPKIGIKFLEEIVTVLETSLKSITIRPISMDDLDKLKDRINYILELKEKYKINMLLSEFSSQSPYEVAFIVLRRCYTEDLEAFLQHYLFFYATRHMFDLDEILRTFIEIEAASSGGGVDGVRLKILLNAFRSVSNKLDCLLQVLKVLDVPWNSTVLELAIAAASSVAKDFTISDTDRVLAQDIQKEVNYAKVKVILKKYNFPLSCSDYTLVLHKLVNAPTVDLSDLKAITEAMIVNANYGNILYINRCLEDCEMRTALDYFNNLASNEKKILLKTMIAKFEQIINGHTNNKKIERNYLDFIKGTKLLNENELQNIEKLYCLKSSYDIKLDMNNIYIETSGAFYEVTSLASDDGEKSDSDFRRSAIQTARTCQTRHSMLSTLLRRTSTSHRVRTFIEKLIASSPKNHRDSGSDIKSDLSNFENGQNSLLLLESWNVLIELVTNCREEHIHYLIKHLSVLNALINTNIVVKNLSIAWKFHYIYLPISSSLAINELISFYKTMSSLNNLEKDFPNIYHKCDFIPFRMISHAEINLNLTEKSSCDDLLEIKDKTARRLLTNIIASQDLDETLMISLLLVLKTVEVTEDNAWISDTLKGQNDLLSPAVICYLSSLPMRRTFSLDTNVTGSTVSYPPQYILESKFNIHLSEIALPEHTEDTWDVKVILFYVLKRYPDISFDRLSELCHALNISASDGLSLQLISLIATWNLKYKIFYDEFGCRQISIDNDENRSNKCITIWDSIDNKNFLKDILNDFWRNGEITLHGRVVSINPYYYEVYLCIYQLIFGSNSMDAKNIKEYYLINFLKNYKRRSAPKQYEFELFSIKGMFPEIGYFRLPFHLFMRDDMWSNLKSEITLESYERWIPAVALLSLDSDFQTAKDMICSNAVKQTMTTRKRNESIDMDSKETEPWRLTTREEPLLRAAHRCVRHIANMEWAGACLFYVLQGCTRGADQVAAAHLCYQFAQRWAAFQPGNRAVRQMERLHATLSTRHALYKIEWACEEFVRLSTEPAQLIRALYLHPDFVEKMTRHDVNRAANEIADKNGIDVSSIRIQILANILEKSCKTTKHKDLLTLSTTELMTAKYILKATCPKMGAIYLSRIVFDDESDHNKCKKLRAVQCLMSVVEPDTAIKVTKLERVALWTSLLDMLCIVKLENIDMPWIVMAYMQDKVRALEQLLPAVEGHSDGLKIATELARRFGTPLTIHNLISRLLSAGIYEEMIPLLLKVSKYPPNNLICAAWRTVLLSPFQRADYPITERQRTKCLDVVNLLPICPVIKDEDLIEIWKNCVRCKSLGLGCLVLPYMTAQARQSLTELSKVDRRNLIASLKNLHTESYLVSGAMHVIENIASRSYR